MEELKQCDEVVRGGPGGTQGQWQHAQGGKSVGGGEETAGLEQPDVQGEEGWDGQGEGERQILRAETGDDRLREGEGEKEGDFVEVGGLVGEADEEGEGKNIANLMQKYVLVEEEVTNTKETCKLEWHDNDIVNDKNKQGVNDGQGMEMMDCTGEEDNCFHRMSQKTVRRTRRL